MPTLRLRMARAGGISVSRAAELERQLTEILAEGLLMDGEIRINGFGVLRIQARSGTAWDPKKMQRVKRRITRVVTWTAAKDKRRLG